MNDALCMEYFPHPPHDRACPCIASNQYVSKTKYDVEKYGEDPKEAFVTIEEDTPYLCEVQFNLQPILDAKKAAHKYYEGSC